MGTNLCTHRHRYNLFYFLFVFAVIILGKLRKLKYKFVSSTPGWLTFLHLPIPSWGSFFKTIYGINNVIDVTRAMLIQGQQTVVVIELGVREHFEKMRSYQPNSISTYHQMEII